MGSRKVDNNPKVTAETNLRYQTELSGSTSSDIGLHFIRFEYSAMLNGGETSRVELEDAYLNILDSTMKSYLQKSRKDAPVHTVFQMGWALDQYTQKWQHTLSSLSPTGNRATDGRIEMIGVDNASFALNGGAADGSVYKGNIEQVITKVVEKYGRDISVKFKTKTNDNKENQWWMHRLDPKTFIMSLLEWAGSLTQTKTQWCVWPDYNDLIIVQQADDSSIPRATYNYRSVTDGQQDHTLSDILEWELLGDNVLQMLRFKVVTNGISAVSGAYYDRITDKSKEFSSEPSVFVGDKDQTSKKFVPKNGGDKAFTAPGQKSPPDEYVGWTSIKSIPELSAGEMGLRYDKYIDGFARHFYLGLNNMLLRCRFRVTGHYIWMGSEGLGVDTISIIMKDSDSGPYWLSGNWIVYGYRHVMTRDMWYTDLYCSKLDQDASGKQVGSG